jgi:hypothetical protein
MESNSNKIFCYHLTFNQSNISIAKEIQVAVKNSDN